MELELSAPAPVQHQCLCLPIQHPHGQELVQRGALCALHPGCGAGSALSQLAGCPLLVDAHQSALGQHHALLVLYPTLLVVGGYRPSPRRIPQVLAFLFGSALPIYFLNKPLGTNFYFLNNRKGISSPVHLQSC